VDDVTIAEGELSRAEALDHREGRVPAPLPERNDAGSMIG
jgi:hypothetical protein